MLAMDQEQKDKVVHRLYRRLQVRERLQAMAQAVRGAAVPERERELERLRDYLSEWVSWQGGYMPAHLGGPRGAGWVSAQSNATSATEYLERADRWAMEVVHHAVEEGLAQHPDGVQMRAALRLRWLNERVAAVFRSNRFDVELMADRAERALVELVKRRGLPL